MGEPIRRRELPHRNELVGLLGARADESIGAVRNPLYAAGCRRVVEGVYSFNSSMTCLMERAHLSCSAMNTGHADSLPLILQPSW